MTGFSHIRRPALLGQDEFEDITRELANGLSIAGGVAGGGVRCKIPGCLCSGAGEPFRGCSYGVCVNNIVCTCKRRERG